MSSGELRQRIVSNRERDPIMTASNAESQLSAPTLLAASPIHASPAMKLHVPVLYDVLPAALQWCLARCGPASWRPQWKRRYLIALGGYLYRFTDGEGATPKGAPLHVATTDSRLASRDDDDYAASGAFDALPEGCAAVFAVASLGKTQYFAVESLEEARVWVDSLREMRQSAITREMGHAHDVPYPQQWKAFDAAARRLKEQKTRIKRKLEAMDRKEQEMVSMGGVFG